MSSTRTTGELNVTSKNDTKSHYMHCILIKSTHTRAMVNAHMVGHHSSPSSHHHHSPRPRRARTRTRLQPSHSYLMPCSVVQVARQSSYSPAETCQLGSCPLCCPQEAAWVHFGIGPIHSQAEAQVVAADRRYLELDLLHKNIATNTNHSGVTKLWMHNSTLRRTASIMHAFLSTEQPSLQPVVSFIIIFNSPSLVLLMLLSPVCQRSSLVQFCTLYRIFCRYCIHGHCHGVCMSDGSGGD